MPEGSSSEAPVMSPGPSLDNKSRPTPELPFCDSRRANFSGPAVGVATGCVVIDCNQVKIRPPTTHYRANECLFSSNPLFPTSIVEKSPRLQRSPQLARPSCGLILLIPCLPGFLLLMSTHRPFHLPAMHQPDSQNSQYGSKSGILLWSAPRAGGPRLTAKTTTPLG